MRGMSCGSSKTSDTESLCRIGLNMPRSAENRSTMSNHAGEMVTRPGLDLGQVEQVVDHLGQLAGRGLDEVHLLLLLVGERPVEAVLAGCG